MMKKALFLVLFLAAPAFAMETKQIVVLSIDRAKCLELSQRWHILAENGNQKGLTSNLECDYKNNVARLSITGEDVSKAVEDGVAAVNELTGVPPTVIKTKTGNKAGVPTP